MTANPSNEVIEGTDVTLTCVAHGHPRPGVRWRKEGGFLPGGLLEVDTPIVRLSPARTPDRGEYICKAFNGVVPDAINSIYLKVDGKNGVTRSLLLLISSSSSFCFFFFLVKTKKSKEEV